MMKRCPVCKTNLFEDMDICYGCMYRFGSEPELEKKAEALTEGDQLISEKSATKIPLADGVASETLLADAAASKTLLTDGTVNEIPLVDSEIDETLLAGDKISETLLANGKLTTRKNDGYLFDHFLVEFERFLRDFLINRNIKV